MYSFSVHTEVNRYSVFSPSLTLSRNNKIPQLHDGSEALDSFHSFYSQVSVYYLVNFGICSLLASFGNISGFTAAVLSAREGFIYPPQTLPKHTKLLDFQGRKGFLGIAEHGMKYSATVLNALKASELLTPR